MIKLAHHRPSALIVDDNSLMRMFAATILEDAGFIPVEAADGDQAIKLLRDQHQQVQILFTDVEMPGALDGFALSRKTARSWPHIVIVVASGRMAPNSSDLPPGAVFIAKPFDSKLVHGQLRTLLHP